MPRTAADILATASFKAKVPGFTGVRPGQSVSFALQSLNDVLGHICRTVDLSAARGQWDFVFNAALTTAGGGNIVASGPNPLPMDYLRVPVSGGSTGAQNSSIWYLQGVPYPMVEIDLTEFDLQVQQAGTQSYPYFWAKDIAQQSLLGHFTGDITIGNSTIGNVIPFGGTTAATTGIQAGMSIAGGIGGLVTIQPGTTITTVNAASLVLSATPELPSSGQANITQTAASLVIGYPGAGYAYPPPSGAYNAMIRYQRLMPPMTQAQVDAGAFCWFDDTSTLESLLVEKLMGFSDDERNAQWEQKAMQSLGKYLKLADDNANRAQVVQMDRRYFGGSYANLPVTKQVGW